MTPSNLVSIFVITVLGYSSYVQVFMKFYTCYKKMESEKEKKNNSNKDIFRLCLAPFLLHRTYEKKEGKKNMRAR